MKNYKYALVDWDGTIVNSLDVWLNCLRQALGDFGHQLTDKEIGANYESFRLRSHRLGITNVDRILHEVSRHVEQQMKHVKLCDGAIELLGTLKSSDIKVALVTQSVSAQVNPVISKLRLNDKFDAIVCGDNVRQQKPNPEAAYVALRLLGGTPEHAVMIGDSATDITFSHNAALDSILFHPAHYNIFYNLTELKGLNPTYVVTSLRDINRLLR